MKYLMFFLNKLKKIIKGIIINLRIFFIIFIVIIIECVGEGYSWEDFGLDGFSLNPFDYCNLTDVDYTAILHDDPNGKANVEITEYLTFDVHAGSINNTYKELWRELPEEYVDGVKVTYDVKSVTQIMDNGIEVPYKETSKMYWNDSDYTTATTKYWHHSKGTGRYPDNDESLLIYIPWTYREKLKFKIVYNLNNATLKYNDCSELYLSMYSGNTITKLKSYKANILIPNDIMPSSYYAYTYGTAKSRLPFKESPSSNPGYYTFSIDLNKSDLKFNYHNRYIEFCLLSYENDKHIFTKYAPNNKYSNENVLEECIEENEYYENQNIKFNNYKTILLCLSIVFSIYSIYTAKEKIEEIKEKYEFNTPDIDYEYFREIPSDLDPIFASELVFMKDPFNENKEKKEEYAAILLSLVRKKYVQICKVNATLDWTDTNTIIILEPLQTSYIDNHYQTVNSNTNTILEELTTSERLYLELLERHSRPTNTITISSLQKNINLDYEYTNSFVKDIERKPIIESGVIQGYFSDGNYDMPKKQIDLTAKINLFAGLILLIVINLISYFTPMALSFGAYTILGITYLWKYIYLTSKASNMVLFTQYGINEQAKWVGLYQYLNSDTLMREKNVPDLVLWEKYLIYATAFGISEKVVQALKIHTIDLDIEHSSILNTHFYTHSTHFHRTSRALGRSIHTSSRGGGFGGHGYGGGGRGGGGGGGGH